MPTEQQPFVPDPSKRAGDDRVRLNKPIMLRRILDNIVHKNERPTIEEPPFDVDGSRLIKYGYKTERFHAIAGRCVGKVRAMERVEREQKSRELLFTGRVEISGSLVMDDVTLKDWLGFAGMSIGQWLHGELKRIAGSATPLALPEEYKSFINSQWAMDKRRSLERMVNQ